MEDFTNWWGRIHGPHDRSIREKRTKETPGGEVGKQKDGGRSEENSAEEDRDQQKGRWRKV